MKLADTQQTPTIPRKIALASIGGVDPCIGIQDLFRILHILSPNEQFYTSVERQAVAIVVPASGVAPDHRRYFSRLQECFRKIGIDAALIRANDDQLKLFFRLM